MSYFSIILILNNDVNFMPLYHGYSFNVVHKTYTIGLIFVSLLACMNYSMIIHNTVCHLHKTWDYYSRYKQGVLSEYSPTL